MASGKPDYTQTASVNITNASITVDASGSTIPVDIQNASIAITGAVTATISGTPSVSISGTPSVSISGTPSVSISGTPNVAFASAQDVNIASTTGNVDVEIKNVAAISVDASGSTVPISVAGTVTVDASGSTVPISHSGDLDVNVTNATITVDASGSTVPISVAGTVNVDASGATVPISAAGTIAVTKSGTWEIDNATIAVTKSGTWEIDNATIAVTESGAWNISTLVASVMKERWNQTGSAIINDVNIYVDAVGTLYTVSANKDFYLKEVHVYAENDQAAGESYTFKDGGTGGTTKLYIGVSDLSNGYDKHISLNVPLKFGTDVYTGVTGTPYCHIILVGWEEDD